MTVTIAIPEPTSSDAAYNQHSLPQYMAALEAAGALPIVVPVNGSQDLVASLLAGVRGILLPGSGFDVDPERYGEARVPECGAEDPVLESAEPTNAWLCEACGAQWSDPEADADGDPERAGR